jgi:hypothetical protein
LTSEFFSLSRWGQAPVIEHDGRVFLQSASILEHLPHTLGNFDALTMELNKKSANGCFGMRAV